MKVYQVSLVVALFGLAACSADPSKEPRAERDPVYSNSEDEPDYSVGPVSFPSTATPPFQHDSGIDPAVSPTPAEVACESDLHPASGRELTRALD